MAGFYKERDLLEFLRKKTGKKETHLSHLSLLFRHGSQLIAFRARLVGGLPSFSAEPGAGDVLCRITPVVTDLPGFGRGAEDEPCCEASSAIVVYGDRYEIPIREDGTKVENRYSYFGAEGLSGCGGWGKREMEMYVVGGRKERRDGSKWMGFMK